MSIEILDLGVKSGGGGFTVGVVELDDLRNAELRMSMGGELDSISIDY